MYFIDNCIYWAYTAFVRPKLVYDNLVYLSVAMTNLDKMHQVQQQAHNMFHQLPNSSLEQRREAAAVGLYMQTLTWRHQSIIKSLSAAFQDPNT